MHKLFIPWLLSVLVSWVPPGRHIEVYPDSWETKEQGIARYTSYAEDLLEVAFDPEEAPLFRGPPWAARLKTALLLAAISLKESGLRKDVDSDTGKLARGDHGRSVCVMQINLGEGKVPLEGELGKWTAKDLVGLDNRKNCFRVGLRMVRRSFKACGGQTVSKLAGYTSGSCDKGLAKSQERIRAYNTALARHPKVLTLPGGDLNLR